MRTMGVPRTSGRSARRIRDTNGWGLTDKGGECERGPEADSVLELGGGEGGKGAEVDAPVEEVVDSGDRDVRIDDEALAVRHGRDEHARLAILVRNERADITLDPASAERNDDGAHDPARNFERERERDRDQLRCLKCRVL